MSKKGIYKKSTSESDSRVDGENYAMKIIQIMPEFGLAGAERMCERLSIELVESGNEVIVVSLYDYHSPITEHLEKLGIKTLYLRKRPGLDLKMIFRLMKIFHTEKPDVIHTHRYVMQYAIPAAAFSRIPRKIHTVHNIATKENTFIARKVNGLFYSCMGVIPVALSKEIQKSIIDEYRLEEERIPIVFNGIDINRCRPKISYALSDTINLLHIGRFSEQKNHIALIGAFSRLIKTFPNATLSLIGEGEKEEEIVSLIDKLDLKGKVLLLGIQENVHPFLESADIFILPSLYEGVPMTLIEAMASGLPIIASKVGGVPEMIEDGVDGLLIDPDEKSIEDAINSFASDESLRRKCGENAFRKAAEFSSKIMGEKYLRIYNGDL